MILTIAPDCLAVLSGRAQFSWLITDEASVKPSSGFDGADAIAQTLPAPIRCGCLMLNWHSTEVPREFEGSRFLLAGLPLTADQQRNP